MADPYVPRTWEKGEVLTAAGVNHLEQGVASVVQSVADGPVSDVNGQRGEVQLGFKDLLRTSWAGTAGQSTSILKQGDSVLRQNEIPNPAPTGTSLPTWSTVGSNASLILENNKGKYATSAERGANSVCVTTPAILATSGTTKTARVSITNQSDVTHTFRLVVSGRTNADGTGTAYDSTNPLVTFEPGETKDLDASLVLSSDALSYKVYILNGDGLKTGDVVYFWHAIAETGDQAGPYFDGDSFPDSTKSSVGLDKVDNTADADKPVSNATKTALDKKVDNTRKVTGTGALTGGGDLSADRSLDLSEATKTLISGKAESSRKVTGTGALTGGGDLSADRSLDLTDEMKSVLSRASAFLGATGSTSGIRVTPEQFGAVGDGVTNDTPAWQLALNAIKSAGGGVLECLPGRVYLFGGTAIVPSNTIIEGNNAKILSKQGSSKTIFANQSEANSVGYGAGGRNIHFRNLRMTGDYVNAPGDISTGWNHVDNLSFTNCTFEQGMVNGHYIDIGGCSNVRVVGCTFLGMNPKSGREYIEAIQIDVSMMVAASWKSEPASSFDGLPSRNIIITGNYFGSITVNGTKYPTPNPAGSHSVALTSDAGYYEDVIFSNNVVRGYFIPATQDASGWLHFYSIRGLIIENNHFYWEGSTSAGNPQCIVLMQTTAVYAADQAGLTSPSTTAYTRRSKSVIVSNNVFIGFNTAPTSTDAGHINITYTDDVTVRGNNILNTSASAIRFDNVGIFVISENTIAHGASQNPAIITGNSARGTVSNNSIEINKTASPIYGIHLYRGNQILAIGNVIAGGYTGILVDGADNNTIASNHCRNYGGYGIMIGVTNSAYTAYDVMVYGNRAGSTVSGIVASLFIAATATRCRRFGNLWREGGSVTDNGSGTTTVATDQTT